MSLVPFHSLDSLFQQYHYAVIFLGVMLESTGLPLPGESLMIAAALYAASTHHLNIFILVALPRREQYAATRSAILSAAGSVTVCWRDGDAK